MKSSAKAERVCTLVIDIYKTLIQSVDEFLLVIKILEKEHFIRAVDKPLCDSIAFEN